MKVISKSGDEVWVQLSSGEKTVISSVDSWIMKEFPCWGIAGSQSKYVFVERSIKTEYSTVRERVYLHRVIVRPPARVFSVDHIDRDRLNNRRSNLRLCTRAQNMANVGPRNGKKYKGVFKRKDASLKKPFSSYIAYINAKCVGMQKRRYLGRFATAEDAAAAYNRASKELYGEFAFQNVIE